MLDWDDLRTFLMIARHRTLSAAARALQVQQPTMGRRLEALEQRAGATLLQKTPAGYVLTPSGEAVFATVERIEAEALAVERLIAGKDLRLEGTVRLTTVETLAAEVLSPVLAAFRLTHPAVQVEVVAGTRSLSLTKREADVALRVAPFTQPDVVAQKIGEIAYGLYASAAYLARGGPPTLILTEPDLLDTPEMRWLLSVVPDAGAAVVSNSRLVHRAAARDGMGLACLARYLGDAEPGLVRLPAPKGMPPAPVRDLWLGVHGDMRHMPRIRSFLDALRSGLRQAAGRLRPAG
jgi:DNA-binding transcriptional LysR family regulator